MTILKMSTAQDVDKWNKAIETLESVLPMVEQDEKFAKRFYAHRLESAQFWKRYSLEKTADVKLREIAENDLQIVLGEEIQLETIAVEVLRDAIELIKKDFSPAT